MKTERTFQGFEATVKSSGAGRFGGVAFLSVWLVMWTFGECFVLFILLKGGWSLLTGHPPGEGRDPLALGPSLATGVFLLVWLAFCTLGGVLAWRELLRLLFGKDWLLARPDALEIEHSYGLFRTRQSLQRNQLIRFYVPVAGKYLSAETSGGVVEIVRLGTKDELADIALALNAEYELSSEAPPRGILPESWKDEVSIEGESTLLKNPAIRRKQAITMWGIFVPLALVAGYLLYASLTQNLSGVFPAITGAAAGLTYWGAYRLSFFRNEWTLSSGRLALQQRRHGKLFPRFAADTLQLREDKDSDGDPWFRLIAVQAEAHHTALPHKAHQHEREVGTSRSDPTELRSFGRWLSHRCKLSFTDRTTAQAKAEDLEALKAKLAASGRIGQLAARLLGRLKPS